MNDRPSDVYMHTAIPSASAQRINNDFDEDGVLNVAQDDAGDAGDRGLFGQALQFLNNNKPSADDDVDEDRVTSAHQQAYGWVASFCSPSPSCQCGARVRGSCTCE